MQDELEKVEEYEQFFNYRYRLKKRFNAAVCFVIVFCGISAILWSVFIFHNNLINRLRYMTFDGTIFTTVTSLLCGIACMTEAKYDFEVTNRHIYFLRLSSATTEFVICRFRTFSSGSGQSGCYFLYRDHDAFDCSVSYPVLFFIQ